MSMAIVGIGTRTDAAVAAAHAQSRPGVVCQPPVADTTGSVLLPQSHVLECHANSTSDLTIAFDNSQPSRSGFAHGWQKDH